MFNKYLKQLMKECENIWQNGRQLCEAVSMNGHPCVYELHRIPTEQDLAKAESKDETEISEIEEEESETERTKSQNEKSEDTNNYESDSKYYGKSRSRSIRSESKRRDTSQKLRMDRLPSNESRSRHDSKKTISFKVHSSNIITIAASNCGEFQRERLVRRNLKGRDLGPFNVN